MEQFRITKNCDFSGVYAIVNLDNHKVYIGSSRNIKNRLKNHKTKLTNNKSNNKAMQNDFNNGNKFIAYVITKTGIKEETYHKDNYLRYFEKIAIREFEATNPDKGYNKRENENENLKEIYNIKSSKQDLDFYFRMFDPSFYKNEEGREEEKREFINKVLQ